MNLKVLAFVLFLLFFAQSSKIRQLTASNLQQFSKDNSYWLIQITQGKCSECKQHEKQLGQIAHMMDGAIKVGRIDAKLIPNLKIPKSPTYIFTRSDQPQNSKPFQGSFVAKDVISFCLKSLSEFMKKRQGQSGGSSEGSGGQQESRSQRSQRSSSQESKSSGSVIQLTDAAFESKVLKSKDAWLVQFYSPGCGHCRNFQPEYNKIPKLIGKRCHIARIDGSKQQQFMRQYQVKGFPTVLFFGTGEKQTPVPYQGERTAEAVVQWLKTQQINEQKRQILELTKESYAQECNRNIVCFIFILNKKSQKSKLSFVNDIIAEQPEKPFRFFYSERLLQFEEQLMISDRDTPKMVSIWDSLNSYRIYNGAVNAQELQSFLKGVLQRRGWIKAHNKLSVSMFSSNQEL